jgi:hypothetical protein
VLAWKVRLQKSGRQHWNTPRSGSVTPAAISLPMRRSCRPRTRLIPTRIPDAELLLEKRSAKSEAATQGRLTRTLGERSAELAATSRKGRIHAASRTDFSSSSCTHVTNVSSIPAYLRRPVRPSVLVRHTGWPGQESGRPRRPELSRNCFSNFLILFRSHFFGLNQSKTWTARIPKGGT